MASSEVHETEFYTLTLGGDGIVWMERTEAGFPTLEDLARGYDEAFAVIDPWRKRMRREDQNFRFGIIYDVRRVDLARTDPGFERVHAEYRPKLFARSPALAVVTRTIAGVAQARRLGHQDGSRFYSTNEPADAVRYIKATLETLAW